MKFSSKSSKPWLLVCYPLTSCYAILVLELKAFPKTITVGGAATPPLHDDDCTIIHLESRIDKLERQFKEHLMNLTVELFALLETVRQGVNPLLLQL